jgi:hypothetical protein
LRVGSDSLNQGADFSKIDGGIKAHASDGSVIEKEGKVTAYEAGL